MTEKLIYIPTINDKPEDYIQLFNIRSLVNGYDNIRFDFSKCEFLRPNAIAFLGGLARVVESRRGSVIFDWDTLHDQWIKNTLRQNGFASAFGDTSGPWSGTSIPYREDRIYCPNGFVDYLSDCWLGRGWVHISEILKNAIVERVLELYVNAFEHSKTKVGVFSCGQYFQNLNQLHLSIIDYGVGIPANVRGYLKMIRPDIPVGNIDAGDCLNWAFQSTTTTRPGSTSRGLGLDLLKSFIKVNQGIMQAYSNDGFAEISNNQETYKSFSSKFEGTSFNIKLKCDEKYYILASEKSY